MEIIKDSEPPAKQKCPNTHPGPADEVQVVPEAHKFQRSSREQKEQQPLTSDGCRSEDGPGQGVHFDAL